RGGTGRIARVSSRPAPPAQAPVVFGAAAGSAGLAAAAGAGLAASVEAPSLPLAAPSPLLAAPSPPSARLRLRSPSFLKSVSYQPLPARRNAGAVTARFTAA